METFDQEAVKGIWAWMSIACATLKPLRNIWCLVLRGVYVLASGLSSLVNTDTRELTSIKTIGEACRQQAQALIRGVDHLYVHKCLNSGSGRKRSLASLFAKQSMVMAR